MLQLDQETYSKSIPHCPLNQQREIIEKLDRITERNNHLSKNILRESEYISLFRHAILQEAFSGKLVPQDPNDEPASELFKKIKIFHSYTQLNRKIESL